MVTQSLSTQKTLTSLCGPATWTHSTRNLRLIPSVLSHTDSWGILPTLCPRFSTARSLSELGNENRRAQPSNYLRAGCQKILGPSCLAQPLTTEHSLILLCLFMSAPQSKTSGCKLRCKSRMLVGSLAWACHVPTWSYGEEDTQSAVPRLPGWGMPRAPKWLKKSLHK